MKLTSFFFLASVFCVTFEKVHWNIAGNVSLADVLAILFLVSFLLTTARTRVPRTTAILLALLRAVPARVPVRLFRPVELGRDEPVEQGLTKWVIHFRVPRRGGGLDLAARPHYFWRTLAWFSAGSC